MHLGVHTSSPTCASQHRLPARQQRGLRERPGPAPHPRWKKRAGAGTTANRPEHVECRWITGRHGEQAATYPNVFGSSTIFIFPAEAKRPARREQLGAEDGQSDRRARPRRGPSTHPAPRSAPQTAPEPPSPARREAEVCNAAGRCLRRARPWSAAGAGAGAGLAASRLSRRKRRPR